MCELEFTRGERNFKGKRQGVRILLDFIKFQDSLQASTSKDSRHISMSLILLN